jgi:hypothetical protein
LASWSFGKLGCWLESNEEQGATRDRFLVLTSQPACRMTSWPDLR